MKDENGNDVWVTETINADGTRTIVTEKIGKNGERVIIEEKIDKDGKKTIVNIIIILFTIITIILLQTEKRVVIGKDGKPMI